MKIRSCRLALFVFATAGCAPSLPVEKPIEVFEREHEVSLVITSQPEGARVYALASDGKPGELLGSTPLEIGRLQLRKEIWKYHHERTPPALDPPSQSFEQRSDGTTGASAESFERRLWLEAAGYQPTEAQVRLPSEKLPEAYARRRWVTHVTLSREQP